MVYYVHSTQGSVNRWAADLHDAGIARRYVGRFKTE